MKYEAIALEDMKAIMEEVTRELAPLAILEAQDKKALAAILGSLITMMSDIFAYLPEEDQSHILVNCATWYDIGFLAGRSPQKLTEIMDKVNPAIEEAELPEWTDSFVRGLTKDGK
ncbi:MAG: hypothetical protein V1932_06500 [Chloroflexota bacterium]